MYLAYLDDSKNRDWQVVSAVLIPADSFMLLELISATAIDGLMPEDRRDGFEEFHASELYYGQHAFEGIEQNVRFGAIQALLANLQLHRFKVAYGAVNLKQHAVSFFGAAPPQDVAFRRCALGIGQWLGDQALADLAKGGDAAQHVALFIMDDSDPKTRAILQGSFRQLRSRFRLTSTTGNALAFVHDDMYFGSSKFSIGIQMADLCSYFIARHLAGDAEIEHFYKMIEPQIISAVTEE